MHPATPGHHGTLQTAPNSFRMRTYTIGVRNPCRFRTYETGLPQVLWNVHLRTVGGGGGGVILLTWAKRNFCFRFRLWTFNPRLSTSRHSPGQVVPSPHLA